MVFGGGGGGPCTVRDPVGGVLIRGWFPEVPVPVFV
jgi:hypothetical protein